MSEIRKSIEDFTGLYSLSKTLRFELKPVGKTAKNAKKLREFLEHDERRSKGYVIVKRLIDLIHKDIIQNSLEKSSVDWQSLASAIGSGDPNTREKVEEQKIKEISKLFTENIEYKLVFGEKLFSVLLPSKVDSLSESEAEKFLGDLADFEYLPNNLDVKKRLKLYVEDFHNFSCYFTGFHENRKNIYSNEAISTGSANRVVCQNFPKFLTNIKIFDTITTVAPDVVENTQNELKDFLQENLPGKTLRDVFCVDTYNEFIHQKGIDIYNTILGGISDGATKLRGLNEFANLYLQRHKEIKGKKLKMDLLYKQILSDRESFSFLSDALASDEDLVNAIKGFNEDVKITELVASLKNLCKSENCCRFEKYLVWVKGSELANLSHKTTGDWQRFGNALLEKAIVFHDCNTAKQKEKLEKEIRNTTKFSVAEIEIEENKDWFCNYLRTFNNYIDENGNNCLGIAEKFCSAYQENNTLLENCESNNLPRFRENEKEATTIKNYLDSIMNILHFLKPFICDDITECDASFYEPVQECYDRLSKVIPLYNKARNFVTQKPFSTDKIKLKFDNPTLADGWDNNKVRDNTAFLLRKNGLYYLALINPKDRLKEDALHDTSNGEWQRINYKLLPGPNKMLPKVFFSTKGKEKFKPSTELLAGYARDMHKKGQNFDREYLHILIDFFKTNIPRYEGWDVFNFNFSDTESYEDISAFYNEVANGGYKIWFTNLSNADIERWQDEGKIFLFQICNKDFSQKSFGKKNMHTLYWEALFDEDNLKNCVFKLNGQAELFFRPRSVQNPFSHEVGTARVSKRDVTGAPIANDVYLELVEYASGKRSKDTLQDEAKNLLDNNKVIIKNFDRRVTKDKRYTENKYFFHVPLTINFGTTSMLSINTEVNKYLKNNQSVNVIGIDRGERNLLYYSVINRAGEIIEQGSLNEVNNFDYQKKLDSMEKKRQDARKNWKEIGSIKETKAGYLSNVVHKLATLMVRHNAIVVLEDLNSKFKNSRKKIEKQVYQKFEKALIDKLNYLVFKDRQNSDTSGVLCGLQLANQFTSFEKLGRQSGFLFYVPAGYTSVTDPRTGFASLFKFGDYKTQEKSVEFMKKVDSLRYDAKEDKFVFAIDYDKFGENANFRKKWEIWTVGERIVKEQNEDRWTLIKFSLTEKLKNILRNAGVDYEYGENFLPRLLQCSKGTVSCVFWIFRLTVQLRNSNSTTGEDYIQSPVKAEDGTFFKSDESQRDLPIDADANGAYNIARKGLLLLQGIDEHATDDGKIEYKEWKQSNKDWFEFAQSKNTH